MSGLARDGKNEPVSRDEVVRRKWGQGNKCFLVRLTKSRVGKRTRLIHTTMNVVIIHTHISSVTH